MTDITIADITTKTAEDDGVGVFDILMHTVELHLEEQYKAGRLTGAEYGTVYLGALQSVLQQAINFALQEQVADKQAELLTQQILTEVQNTRLSDSKADESEYNVTNLLPKEGEKLDEEIDLLQSRDAEELKATLRKDAESVEKIALMTAQTLGFASDTKQKVLKQMMDCYAVNLSIAGVGNVPEAGQDAAIDALSQNILNEVGATGIVPTTEAAVPVL